MLAALLRRGASGGAQVSTEPVVLGLTAAQLQHKVRAQAKEILRLQKLLSNARMVQIEIEAPKDGLCNVVLTAIGCEEYQFIESCRTELRQLLEKLGLSVKEDPVTAKSSETGEDLGVTI